MIIDTHAHLNIDYNDEEVLEILNRAKESGVYRVILPGCNIETSLRGIELSGKFDCCYSLVGIHPCDIFSENYDLNQITKIENMINSDKVIGIGEIGLDYHWHKDQKEIQKDFFRAQIELAIKYDLPISVHSRDSLEDTYNILKEFDESKLRGVMHCYSGSHEMALKFIELGFFISFAGPLTFKNAKKTKEVCAQLPLDKIVIETDTPYLCPHPFRGKKNEPSYVIHVLNEICAIKQLDLEHVIEQIRKNTFEIFGLLK